jgi:hypothetical protein
MSVRRIQAAIAGLALTPTVALAAELDPLAPCKAIVQAVRSSAVQPGVFNRSVDLERLLPANVIRRSAAIRDLGLAAKAARLFEFASADTVQLQHVGGDIWRAWTIEGTADCTYEKFFRLRPDGGVESLPVPLSFSELCFSSGRDVGAVGAGPGLIETDTLAHPDFGLDIEATPWNGSWGRTCRAALRFTDRFQVTERFCGDRAVCAAGSAAAPGLAERLARSPHRTPGALEVGLNVLGGRGELPTFGAAAHTEFPDYSDTAAFLPVTLAGRRLLAHVGVGGVGWRPIGDYLVTLYPPGDGDHPLAGYVVERRLTGLKSATVSIPQPWVNPH